MQQDANNIQGEYKQLQVPGRSERETKKKDQEGGNTDANGQLSNLGQA